MDDDLNPWAEDPEWVKEEEDGENKEDDDGYFGAQHTLILIDCNPSMFQECILTTDQDGQEDEITPMDAALQACEQILRNKVMHVATSKTGKRDGVGIMLYGTKTVTKRVANKKQREYDNDNGSNASEQHDSDMDDDNDDDDDDDMHDETSCVQILVDLAPPGIEEIKSVRSCLYDTVRGRIRNLQKEFCPENEGDTLDGATPPIRNAVHEANTVLTNAKCVRKPTGKQPPDSKTVWIFTNQNNPCAGNEQEQGLLVKAAEDAAENGLNFFVWRLPEAGDSKLVWGDSILREFVTNTDELGQETLDFDMDEMMYRIEMTWRKTRKVFSFPILLPDWRDNPDCPGIMVDAYRTTQPARKPMPVKVTQRTNTEAEKITSRVDTGTGENLPATKKKTDEVVAESSRDIYFYFSQFASERVPMKPEEVVEIRKASSEPKEKSGLILLGFKRQDAIPPWCILDKPYFLLPNENLVKGSTVAFANLHASMTRKKVLAIGELLTKVGAHSRLVAIYPQAEEWRNNDKNAGQTVPPGFLVVPLPFEDEVRTFEKDGADTATQDLVEEAIDLVRHQVLQQVEFGYSFPNAQLDEFWRHIEAVSLEMKKQPPTERDTIVNEEKVLQMAGPQIDGFRDSLPEDVEKTKKSRAKGGVGTKRKTSAPTPDDSGCDWVELYKSDSISDVTVPKMKSYLRSIGATMSGKKADLVLRIQKSIQERMVKGELQTYH